jgi:hypothetical protein
MIANILSSQNLREKDPEAAASIWWSRNNVLGCIAPSFAF